jgi:hypothetical protein
MPQADFTHTRNAPVFAIPLGERESQTLHKAELRELCQTASASLHAMLLVYDTASELNFDDTARDTMYKVIDRMQLDWQRQLRQVTEVKANCIAGMRDKAQLLNAILDVEADSSDDATPAASLVASLVADLLRQPESRLLEV